MVKPYKTPSMDIKDVLNPIDDDDGKVIQTNVIEIFYGEYDLRFAESRQKEFDVIVIFYVNGWENILERLLRAEWYNFTYTRIITLKNKIQETKSGDSEALCVFYIVYNTNWPLKKVPTNPTIQVDWIFLRIFSII